MEENSKVLTDAQFQGFRDQVKDSTNRMLHNFITMFLFLGVYERSDKATKDKIAEFISIIREDITTVHTKKAVATFELSQDQIDLIQKEMTIILDGCLAPMTKLIERDKEKVDEQKG